MATATSFGIGNSGLQAGTINGPVSTDFHLHPPPDRPESPPSPTALIPFRRDLDFVDRKTILDQVHQKCAIPGAWTALVGLGGVGKSQLAIEYAYRTRDRSPDTWVFWVHASNAARLEQGFRDIADCVRISGRQNPTVNIFKLVHDWLRDSKERWMLVLDNVDDARFLLNAQPDNSGSASKPLRECLPQNQNGSVLITTRSREAALMLVESYDIIVVDPMDEALALALFEKKLGVQGDGNGIAELAAALEFMPLAIVQAAAYISERAPRCSVRQYLDQFRKSNSKKTSLLDHEGGQLRRDREAKNSIITTWQISFDYIRQSRLSAANLLSLMCFFDCQGIPESLLKRQTEQGVDQRDQKERDDDEWEDEDRLSECSQSDEFEEDIVALRNFSFISINTDGTTFKMHGLVQLATRKWLEAHGQLERWKEQFIRNLHKGFPTGEYENWAVYQKLFPHAKSAVIQRPQVQDLLRDWACIMYKAAWYAWKTGNGAEAEKMSVQAMEVRKKILGLEANETLWSMEMVGLVYQFQGLWEKAEELEMQIIETRKTKLGADHPDTLTSIANLASTYWSQGRWKEAEVLEVRVMETRKVKQGIDHPAMLASMANLASTYRSLGRWEKAEELEGRVVETRKKKLGTDHIDTLNGMNNLASTLLDQDRWEEAEELLGQVMETCKTKLGANHPNTLASMNNLAATYRCQGRWEEAEELELQVMETRKTNLGADHPDTLSTMANLALTWKEQRRDAEAIGLMKECVRLRERKLGVNHPYFISSSSVLARWEAEQVKAGALAHGGVATGKGIEMS